MDLNLEKKNILYVVPSMNSGGVEIGIVDIARQNHIKKRFNMFVLSSGGLLRNKLINSGTEVIFLNVKTKNPFKIFFNIKKIEKILIEKKIDLVSAESRAPAWSCYFACKKLNIPLVSTIHGAYDNSLGIFSPLKKLYNSIMCRCENIIFVSEYVMEYSLKYFKKYIAGKNKVKNTAVIPRGIDQGIFNVNNINQNRVVAIQEELKIPDDKIIITLPARFTKIKGHMYFLKVLRFLALYCQNFLCVMVGDIKKHPKFLKSLQKHITKYGLSGFIKIHGDINDITALYTLSNIIVSSSTKAESFGRVSIEAQSMGKIFVGTDLGGTLETVIDGETGFLAPHNDERIFARILLKIINMSQQEKDEIGKAAVKNGKKYSLDIMYDKTVEFYEHILRA
ncbi:MAG: glycosyltransferase [Rickettsiales bacterium]|jgi:glycosyltransferase involved in cell wall biosynthesis|nr:glycosyltransferase [Rickettsiales bacterium]